MNTAATPITRRPQAWKPPKSDVKDVNLRTEDGELISLQRAWNLPWAESAACRDHPVYAPDDWFPISKEASESEGPRQVCLEECAVAEKCLAAALRSNHVRGIWGGLDEEERRNLLRRRAVRASRQRKVHTEDVETKERSA